MPEMVLSEEAQDAVDLLNGKAIEDARAIGREKGPGPRPITVREPKRKPPPTLEAVSFCKGCGKRVPAGRERFCSNACMDDAQEPTDSDRSVQIPIDPDRSAQTCAIEGCGKPVPPRPHPGGKPKLYCSDTCASKARQRRGRQKWHAKWKHVRKDAAPLPPATEPVRTGGYRIMIGNVEVRCDSPEEAVLLARAISTSPPAPASSQTP